MKKLGYFAVVLLTMCLTISACGGVATEEKKSTPADQTGTESAESETAAETVSETEAAAAETEAESPYYFKDMEIVTEDYSIKITDWKVIEAGDEGNEYGDTPVIAFWYDTTNTSGKEIDPMSSWLYIITAVQDNDPNAINKLNTAMLPDASFRDSQMAKIKQGGTVSNAVAYELTDKETPVELTARNSMFDDEIGAMTFDLVSGETSNGASASIGTIENNEKVKPSFTENKIVTSDFTIEILDYKVIAAGDEGNEYGDAPVIAFWYNTTNTSGKDIDPMSAWLYTVQAVQDNDPNMVNELQVASLPDSSFRDSQMATIKAGGTVENAMAYTLTDTETPVELTATDGMFGSELGSQVFELK